MAPHRRITLKIVWAACFLSGVPTFAHLSAQQLPATSMQSPAIAEPPLYGPLGVTPAAVKQGQLGSCYFHAVIAAIANHDASLIKRTIRDPGDGTFNVHLPDGTAETIYLDDVLFGRQNHFDRSDGLWVIVLLRAIAQDTLRKALLSSIAATPLPASARASASQLVKSSDTLIRAYDRAIRSVLYQDGTIDRDTLKTALNSQARRLNIPTLFTQPVLDFLDTQGFFAALATQIKENGELFGAYRAVGQGGLPTSVMSAFGLRTENKSLSQSTAARAAVERINDSGTAMIATTTATLRPDLIAKINSRAEPGWWVMSHAYTVLGYDPTSDTVELRNPWGRQPEPTGEFRLPMNDFLAGFSQITYSR